MYLKNEKDKRGKCLSSRSVLSIDQESGIVSVPISTGSSISVAVEDVRLSIVDDGLALHVCDTKDQLDRILEAVIDNIHGQSSDFDSSDINDYVPDFDHDGEIMAEPSPPYPDIGDRVGLFWPLDDQY